MVMWVGSVARWDTLKLSPKFPVLEGKFVRADVRTEIKNLSEAKKRCEAETESFPTSNKKGPNFAENLQKVGVFKDTS